MKLTPSGYLIILAIVFLATCQEQSVLQPNETSFPTSVLPTSTLTLELPPDTVVPTPMQTRLAVALITPDEIQMEKWKEYQTALAKSVLAHLPSEEVLCEWDILGRSGSDVYVWAVCRGKVGGGSVPAVIHLENNGSVLSVEKPERTGVLILPGCSHPTCAKNLLTISLEGQEKCKSILSGGERIQMNLR